MTELSPAKSGPVAPRFATKENAFDEKPRVTIIICPSCANGRRFGG